MTEDTKQEGITIRIPSKAVIAIVLALAGFAWNKFDTIMKYDTQQQVSEASFEYLQSEVLQLKREVHRLRMLCKSEAKRDTTAVREVIALPDPIANDSNSDANTAIRYLDIVKQVEDFGTFSFKR